MTNIESRPLAIDHPATYRIELQGVLGSSWQDFVGHMQIQVRRAESGAGVTTLTGVVRDQAALAGILNLVYDLGMPLLSVECLGPTDVKQADPAKTAEMLQALAGSSWHNSS